MASIDLKKDFCSQKRLSLLDIFCRRIFEICMYVKRIWTKIPLSILREKGFLPVVYVYDSYLQGDDYEDCFSNVLKTKVILRSLGFTIHPEKSKSIPTQCIIG